MKVKYAVEIQCFILEYATVKRSVSSVSTLGYSDSRLQVGTAAAFQ